MPGLTFRRRFTDGKISPFDMISWDLRDIIMRDTTGAEIFRQDRVEVPAWWSDVQAQVCVSKYFKGALGTPQRETSAQQMYLRVAKTIVSWGVTGGYFADEESVTAFLDDLLYLFCTGRYAPNSPVWFNLGDETSRPQASACFINSVHDTMESILDLGVREGMQFKYGSGSGTDLSRIRSRKEGMRGGGTPSGPMSFAAGWDKMSGAIRSGGKKRRAAKMLSMLCDHGDIRLFITHKGKEERKARALIAAGYDGSIDGEAYGTVDGQNANNSVRVTDDFMFRATGMTAPDESGPRDPAWPLIARTTGLPLEMDSAPALLDLICETAHACGDPGVQYHDEMNRWNKVPSYGAQNATNPCSEFTHVDDTSCNLGSHNLRRYQRDDGSLSVDDFRHGVTISTIAQEIICGDATALLFKQCTCPDPDHARRNGHVDKQCPHLRARRYGAIYPTPLITRRTQETRPLGIGYCGLGAFLMYAGLPYDSDEARLCTAGITALLTGQAYAVSAQIAQHCGGPFPAYKQDGPHMIKLIKSYAESARALTLSRGTLSAPYFVHAAGRADIRLPADMRAAIADVWRTTLSLGTQYGFRNDEVTAIAPTGTISYLMGAQHSTSGEPLLGLITYKRLVGGGYITIAADDVRAALVRMGYKEDQVEEICTYCAEELPTGKMIDPGDGKDLYPETRPRGHLEGAPHLRPSDLPIFDTAFKTQSGTRFIGVMGHVLMLAAQQVHTSMSVSKTVNMPASATVQDFREVYVQAWLRGIKSVSIYRDESKASQPVSTSVNADGKSLQTDTTYAELVRMLSAHAGETGENEGAVDTLRRILTDHAHGHAPIKRQIGPTCVEIRHKFEIAGHTVYFKVGLYPDGKPGELWITVSKQGSTLNGAFGCFSMAVSYALQYGVPITDLIESFRHVQFEPAGYTDLGRAGSIIDYIFRWIETELPARAPGILMQAALALGATPALTTAPAHVPVSVVAPAKPAGGRVCTVCGNLMTLGAGGKCYTCTYCGSNDGGCGP